LNLSFVASTSGRTEPGNKALEPHVSLCTDIGWHERVWQHVS